MEAQPDYRKLTHAELDRRIEALDARERQLSRERSFVQALLDIHIDERTERARGSSLLPIRPEQLAQSLRRRPMRRALFEGGL